MGALAVRNLWVEYGDQVVLERINLDIATNAFITVVGLAGYHERYPNQLSGGQRQRMALARALAVEPRVLLLDEPFGALDAKVRTELREWLRRLHDEVHVTTVLVTHDQEEAMAISDHIAVMDDGRIEQVGDPRELYDKPANPFVMGFLGPVSKVDDLLVRPHDITITTESRVGTREATVVRIVHLGFEVRVELALEGEQNVSAQLTRNEVEELDLREGATVWVRTTGRTVHKADEPKPEAEVAA
jgi:sulfate transport system ATP-binding protein